MSWAIQVECLSKQYKLGAVISPVVDSLYQVIEEKFAAFLPNRFKKQFIDTTKEPVERNEQLNNNLVLSKEQLTGCPYGYFYALRDVSFEINEGDRIGIIGKNGSGKSTLLKILSRITSPSQGLFRFRGRLVSLLEVGTGFHPDLTGRENIILNAKINGMTSRYIKEKFDEIVDFSELGRQIDTPIKRYSSGMYMRLAFAVAAHLESEILIVDEVLAVGDTGFQKKCLDKMLEISGRGRTLLFVSHDMEAMRKLCTHAILFEHGRIANSDKINIENTDETQAQSQALPDKPIVVTDKVTPLRSCNEVTKEYILAGRAFNCEVRWDEVTAPSFDNTVYLTRATLLDKNGNKKTTFDVTEEVVIEIEFKVKHKKWPLNAHVYLDTLDGHRVFFSMDNLDIHDPIREAGTYLEKCNIYSPLLNEGSYKVEIVICTGSNTVHYLANDSLSFEVIDQRLPNGIRGDWTREWFVSSVRPRLIWEVKEIT